MKIVMVDWFDACNSDECINKKTYNGEHKPIHCVTVGHLFMKNKDFILLASEKFDDGDLRHTHTIPRKMITKITCLKE